MKNNKLKFLYLVVCFLISSLWSEIQCSQLSLWDKPLNPLPQPYLVLPLRDLQLLEHGDKFSEDRKKGFLDKLFDCLDCCKKSLEDIDDFKEKEEFEKLMKESSSSDEVEFNKKKKKKKKNK